MKKLTISSFLLICLTLAIDADSIIEKTSKNYKKVDSFTADFNRQMCNISAEVCQLSQGKIWYVEPNLFRVEVSHPDKEVYISDGKFLWIYIVERKEALKKAMGDSPMIFSPRYFLDNYKEEFDCSLEKEDKDSWEIKLVPKAETYFLRDITLKIDKKTYKVTGFSTFDNNDTHCGFEFSNLILNKKIKSSTFNFKIPKGVNVIEE